MKIGILSDTHHYWDPKFALYFADCDEIWHVGDIGDPEIIERLEEIAPTRAVRGNIDGGRLRDTLPEELLFEVEGCLVLMRHIVGRPGRYYRGVLPLVKRHQPTLLVAGHSHLLLVQYDHSLQTLYINPGAAGKYGQQSVRTLIRLCISDGRPHDLEVIELHD